MKDYIVGFAIALVMALAIFFFYVVPEQKNIERKIDEAYGRGLKEASSKIDTIYLPGKEKIVYREKNIETIGTAIIETNDLTTKIKTSKTEGILSGKDSIEVTAVVNLDLSIKSGELLFNSDSTKWYFGIKHKDFEIKPDTIIMKVPKYIEVVKTEVNWFFVTIGYIGGLISTLLFLIFF